MKERGILFKAPLVRALLAGKKTQTRRLIKPQPTRTLPTTKTVEGLDIVHDQGWRWQQSPKRHVYVSDSSPTSFAENLAHSCPYGRPGDRLWVRETFDAPPGSTAPAEVVYRADYERDPDGATWRPSLLMPRWASRITLEVTEIRVQRLQQITEEDAKAEGVLAVPFCRAGVPDGNEHREAFQDLWGDINGRIGPESWSANPWLWCVSFRVCQSTTTPAALVVAKEIPTP